MALGIRIMPTLVRSRPSNSELDTPADASVDAPKARQVELALITLLEDQNYGEKSNSARPVPLALAVARVDHREAAVALG